MRNAAVLFVDDNAIIALETCEFLRDHGFTVFEAGDTANACQILDGHRELSALITDIDLGEVRDGFDIARHARLVRPHLPVVFISGAAAARHYDEGVCDSEFVPKPLHPRQILDALNRVIEHKAA